MLDALKKHWPEYLMEAAALGIFMVSACVFTILLYHPASPVLTWIQPEFPRRILMGIAMGFTAIGLIYSPWGKQSGAHMNPAVTLTFWRLGKVASWDAIFYILAQFTGGGLGVAAVAAVDARSLADPAVNYVTTIPGPGGAPVAFAAELVISFVLILVVLTASNVPGLARYTGLFAGLCVALFITFESPYSGMSMNPARTLGSAIPPGIWNSLWIYFAAPPLGMLTGASLYKGLKLRLSCAKLHHQNHKRCIFCEFQAARQREMESARQLPLTLPDAERYSL